MRRKSLKSLIPIVDDLDRTLENIPDDLGEDHSLYQV